MWRLSTLGGHANCLAAQPGAVCKWALGCGDQTIRVWQRGPTTDSSLIWRGLPSSPVALVWAPDGRLALGCACGEVGVCDVGRGLCLPATVRHQAPIRCGCRSSRLRWLHGVQQELANHCLGLGAGARSG